MLIVHDLFIEALLRLREAVRFSARGPLRPICLPDAVGENFDGSSVSLQCGVLQELVKRYILFIHFASQGIHNGLWVNNWYVCTINLLMICQEVTQFILFIVCTEEGIPSQVLLGAEVPILSAQRCNKESDHKDYDTVVEDTQICAGYLDGGVDHCYVSFNEENINIVSVDM